MFGKEYDIEEYSTQLTRTIHFLNRVYSRIFFLCFGKHQYIRPNMFNNAIRRVIPPMPYKSFKVNNLTREYGNKPEITIDKDISANITPHFFSDNRAQEATIPTIAAGQPRLIAKVILATLNGGPKLMTRAIIGRAIILLIKPVHERNQ